MRRELRLAVIGDPVDHSLSPAMHRAALEASGLVGSYETIRVGVEDLSQSVKRMLRAEYDGFNVTIPLKEHIIRHLSNVEASVAPVGAVNTTVAAAQGYVGHNTDVTGFDRLLERTQIDGKHALVLGAGGAAKACVHVLVARGWDVTVSNRSIERAQSAFARVAKVIPYTSAYLERAVGDVRLLVNATAAGLNKPDESPLPERISLTDDMIVLDLVYAPIRTALLRTAERAGCTVIDGLEFLAAQAADSFELWTGERIPDAFFRKAAESSLNSRAENDSSEIGHTGSLTNHAISTTDLEVGAT